VTTSSNFVKGARDVAPALTGAFPIGVAIGAATVSYGVPARHAMALSMFMFAGAAQLAAVELAARDAPVVFIVITGLIVNLRYLLYSASLAPHFYHVSNAWKWFLSFFLFEINFALTSSELKTKEGIDGRWYLLGTSLPLWLNWQASNAIGIMLGARIPDSLQLDFAIPILFIGLVVPFLEDNTAIFTAVTAGAFALLSSGLPFNIGILVGAVAGIVVGLAFERGEDGWR